MKPEKLAFARRMRQNPTRAEAALWPALQRKQLGVRFRRQALIAGYIVDFYAPGAKLIVEVDGSIHDSPGARWRDAHRERVLTDLGYRVHRVGNSTVLGALDLAVAGIRTEVASINSRSCLLCGTLCATVARLARHVGKYHPATLA